MAARIQAKWQPAQYQFPSTPLNIFSLPNPTAGIEAHGASLVGRAFKLREQEIPSRAAFLLGCAESGLVSDAALERVAGTESLLSMELAITEAIEQYGSQFSIGRRPFTKTAKRRLARIGESVKPLSREASETFLADALDGDLLDPAAACRLISGGDQGVAYLVNDSLKALNRKLPNIVGAYVTDDALMFGCGHTESFHLNLPTDESGASHALRMAVMHGLHAISTGIAKFQEPQELFGLDGYHMSAYFDLWEQFGPLVRGKTAIEIASVIEAIDPGTWEFEVYHFGADGHDEITPGSEPFDNMVLVLLGLEEFTRLFAINTESYTADFALACAEQLSLLKGQPEMYPTYTKVFAAVSEAIASSAKYQSSGSSLHHYYEHPFVNAADEYSENADQVMTGLFVLPSDQFSVLGERVDETLNDMWNNYGLPCITIPIAKGVVTQLALPMMEAIREAERLIKLIASALEESGHAGEQN